MWLIVKTTSLRSQGLKYGGRDNCIPVSSNAHSGQTIKQLHTQLARCSSFWSIKVFHSSGIIYGVIYVMVQKQKWVVVAVNHHIMLSISCWLILLYHPSVCGHGSYDYTVYTQAIWFFQELLQVLHSVSTQFHFTITRLKLLTSIQRSFISAFIHCEDSATPLFFLRQTCQAPPIKLESKLSTDGHQR